jgi:Uma2 family endonuclease
MGADARPIRFGTTVEWAPWRKVQPRVSFADLERAPEDGRRYELYDGEVYVVPAPMPRHQRVQIRLVEWLDDYVESFGGFAVCAPIDIVFSEYDVVHPDVLFFGPPRAHLVDLDRAIRHAPDLCVEILSPSTEATDRGRKMQMFARYRVPEYWIVDPVEETIEVHRLEAGSYLLVQRVSGDDKVPSPAWADEVKRCGAAS